MESESSFSSIQTLIAARTRPKSEIIHSQLSSESNYLHLLRSLQPPPKEPPEDAFARLEGCRRATGTVLLFGVLQGAREREKFSAWSLVKRVGLFQGDNFAEYYSSVGSVGKLRDVEVLRNCERALFRCASRRITNAFTRWKEWTKWLHIALLAEVIRMITRFYRANTASGFNAIRAKFRAKRQERDRNMQRCSRFVLAWMRYGNEGCRQALSTWRNTLKTVSFRRATNVQTQMLKYKVSFTQNIERKVLFAFISACHIHRHRLAMRAFNQWRHCGKRLRVQVMDQTTDPIEDSEAEEKCVQEVKRRLLDMSLEVLQGFNYL